MATDPFQSAYSYMDQASNNMMPSPQSLDRSAARLRSSIDTQGNADDQSLQDQFAKRGRINTGGYDAARQRAMASRYSAMGTGMAQEQQNYDQNVMTGAKNLGDMGANYGKVASDQGSLAVQNRSVDIQGKDVLLKNLMDMFTGMGAVGQTTGSPEFNNNFAWLKTALFNALGLGQGSSGNPGLGL